MNSQGSNAPQVHRSVSGSDHYPLSLSPAKTITPRWLQRRD